MKKTSIIVAAVLAIAGYIGINTARAQEVAGPVPWVSHISGKDDSVMIKQADTDWFEATVNTPIGEGDMIWQDKGGRSEVYIDKGTYLRLEAGTGVQFDKLSDSEVRVILTRGQMVAANGSGTPMVVDVPGQSVILSRGAGAGIAVSDQGDTEVTARHGRVNIQGPKGEFRVLPGQSLTADSTGQYPRLNRVAGNGDLERWSDSRDAQLAATGPAPTTVVTYLPEPVTVQLGLHGVWMNDPGHGWVWRPRVAVGWSPYRVGRWTHRPGWGWTWVSYEPWGWYPYHYGRWVVTNSGWVWVPVRARARWSPALVFWVEGPDYIGWQPLPVGVTLSMVINLGPTHVHRYIDRRCITVVRYADFHRGHYHRYVRTYPHTSYGSYKVVRAPHHIVHRPIDVTHYRTPKNTGYVPRTRAPQDRTIYARPGTGSSPGRTNLARPDYGNHRPADNSGYAVRDPKSTRDQRPGVANGRDKTVNQRPQTPAGRDKSARTQPYNSPQKYGHQPDRGKTPAGNARQPVAYGRNERGELVEIKTPMPSRDNSVNRGNSQRNNASNITYGSRSTNPATPGKTQRPTTNINPGRSNTTPATNYGAVNRTAPKINNNRSATPRLPAANANDRAKAAPQKRSTDKIFTNSSRSSSDVFTKSAPKSSSRPSPSYKAPTRSKSAPAKANSSSRSSRSGSSRKPR